MQAKLKLLRKKVKVKGYFAPLMKSQPRISLGSLVVHSVYRLRIE